MNVLKIDYATDYIQDIDMLLIGHDIIDVAWLETFAIVIYH